MISDHAHYIAQLKERRPEIGDFLLRCERDHLTKEDFTAMRHCVRSLLALAENDSDARLYRLAQSMREALDESSPALRINLISLARLLLSACHKALTTMPGSALTIKPRSSHMPHVMQKKPTLLSVDDDRIIGEMVKTMFGEHANLLFASNGVDGLNMIRRHMPDLVLLDDTMPQMTGMKLLEILHDDARLRNLTVIMLTSNDGQHDITRAMNAGAADYVIKPFDPELLTEKVLKHLSAA